MDIKTAPFHSPRGDHELTVTVCSYAVNKRLAIDLLCKEDGYWEPYAFLTVNLPEVPLQANEAFIKDFDENAGLLDFVLKNKLGKVLPGQEGRMDGYQKALLAHLKEAALSARSFTVDTVYFGGGTPSYYGGKRLKELLAAVRKHYRVEKDAEITFEANPDSADVRTLRSLRRAGFNRISLGMQSACPAELKAAGRPHTVEQGDGAAAAARKAKLKNLSLDLIYGLPGQTMDSWRRTVEHVLELDPEHLSCYGLKVEEGTRLAQRVAEGLEIPFCQEAIQVEYPNEPRSLDPPLPDIALEGPLSIDLEGVTVRLFPQPCDHSMDGLLVHCPEDKVVFLGDSLYLNMYQSPWHYTQEKLFPLLDTLEGLKADWYLPAHHDKPMTGEAFLEFSQEQRRYSQAAGRDVTMKAALERLREKLGREPGEEEQEGLRAFILGNIVKER